MHKWCIQFCALLLVPQPATIIFNEAEVSRVQRIKSH